MTISRSALQQAVLRACELDVQSLKPGNVSLSSPGHGMSAADFLTSAKAICEPITECGISVGERIYAAIEATQRAVSCNTNLGIVLLIAPLIQATEIAHGDSLADRTQQVLNSLTLEDADWAYRAIRLAKPGGMGKGVAHDIAKPPQITMLQAMREAADRDQIARLYASGFRDLFQRNVVVWREALARWGSAERATTAVFLESLAREPDSLIARKLGNEKSEAISRDARELWQAFNSAVVWGDVSERLVAWDAELKTQRINPGTTADITVATIFLADLQDMR
jgi:triphosphoribosyl-dephospho-CoA synthase